MLSTRVGSVSSSRTCARIAAFETKTTLLLTDGRGPGTSGLWSAGAQAALSRLLSLTLAYDGRAAPGAPTIHTLRMQVSATF